MSIPGIQNAHRPYPVLPTAEPLNDMRSLAHADGFSFDRFQKAQSEPNLSISLREKISNLVFHPFQSLRLVFHQAPVGSGEGLFARIKMYNAVRRSLDSTGRRQLKTLLKEGVLSQADTDNRHTTLYQLYAMATTQRGRGYDAKTILRDTVGILSRPYQITQKFAPLSETVARQVLSVRNNPGLNRAGVAPPVTPLRWSDLNVENSATCVSSSVMYYMADKKPGELARHLNELTSPMNAFFEKARLDEISPDDPRQATAILKQNGLKYFISGPGEVTIKVENPPAGVLRAVDSQRFPLGGQYRSGIESAYQSALTYLATKSYDPATDMRDSEVPGEGSKGLTEAEKTLMEIIIKDNGGVQSITYQAVAGKNNPAPGEEGKAYLYGYTRSFEQTAADLVEALKMGEFVIIGITDTDASGAIVGGHEITITSAFVDKKDGQLKFIVADSDDGVSSLVVRSASELIPRIHHAGMPLQLSRKINRELAANRGSYFVPDRNDAAQFKLLAHQSGPMPAEQPPQQESPQPTQPTMPNAAPIPQQQIEWVPVYPYYPNPTMSMMPAALPNALPGYPGYPAPMPVLPSVVQPGMPQQAPQPFMPNQAFQPSFPSLPQQQGFNNPATYNPAAQVTLPPGNWQMQQQFGFPMNGGVSIQQRP